MSAATAGSLFVGFSFAIAVDLFARKITDESSIEKITGAAGHDSKAGLKCAREPVGCGK